MEEEIYRVIPPLLEEGGSIPSWNHDVPFDIFCPNFIEYARLLARLTGWLSGYRDPVQPGCGLAVKVDRSMSVSLQD